MLPNLGGYVMEPDFAASFPDLAGEASERPVDARLSRILTIWSKVFDQFKDHPDSEQWRCCCRCCVMQGQPTGTALPVVRNPDVAEEVVQRFSLRFLEGRIRPPEVRQGRFRDYLKTTLRNLIREYWAGRWGACQILRTSRPPRT